LITVTKDAVFALEKPKKIAPIHHTAVTVNKRRAINVLVMAVWLVAVL
jgi:hypothetical protein